jgi:predicted  nucleic acid-binding Zn-ribbon protein
METVRSTATAGRKVTAKTRKSTKKTRISPEQRYQMIAEAAYFRAEKRGFTGGDMSQDWLEAEAEIDDFLKQQSKPNKKKAITQKAFLKKLEGQIKEWDDKFEKLQDKAKKAKAEIQADVEKQISALGKKRTAAQKKVVVLSQKTEDTWESVKDGVEKTWEEMQEALDRFVSRFK